MPTADDFRMELHRMMYEAMKEGHETVEINSGELHRRVGDYPGPNHRMPVCCEVMRDAIASDAGDVVLSEPPSGQGASFDCSVRAPPFYSSVNGERKANPVTLRTCLCSPKNSLPIFSPNQRSGA